MRTGLIAKKIGMTRVLTKEGKHIPVTLLCVEDCSVVSVKTKEKHGYNALQLGFGNAKANKINKPMRGYFAKIKVDPKIKMSEFRVSSDAFLKVNDKLSVAHFLKKQYVDITGLSKGKGFAGAMKRHNFKGLAASHGVSISHRSHGSTGQCQDPGKIFKGTKMAGRLGHKKVTVQSLEVFDVDESKGLIFVKGSVPGAKNDYLLIRDSIKLKNDSIPYPAVLVKNNDSVDKKETQEPENEDENKKI